MNHPVLNLKPYIYLFLFLILVNPIPPSFASPSDPLPPLPHPPGYIVCETLMGGETCGGKCLFLRTDGKSSDGVCQTTLIDETKCLCYEIKELAPPDDPEPFPPGCNAECKGSCILEDTGEEGLCNENVLLCACVPKPAPPQPDPPADPCIGAETAGACSAISGCMTDEIENGHCEFETVGMSSICRCHPTYMPPPDGGDPFASSPPPIPPPFVPTTGNAIQQNQILPAVLPVYNAAPVVPVSPVVVPVVPLPPASTFSAPALPVPYRTPSY